MRAAAAFRIGGSLRAPSSSWRGGVIMAAVPPLFKFRRHLLPLASAHLHQNTASRTFTKEYSSFANNMSSATTFYDFKPLDKRGQEVPLSDYRGKVVLVVNTASKCGFTGQYAGLEKIYKSITEKHPDDFVVLGFPCNQFGSQEPGSNDEIQSFCQVNYGVTFPIMQKVEVNGDKAAPLYEWLKSERPGLLGLKRIKWNFEKFLVGRDGRVVNRWASTTTPESLEKEIVAEINKKAA
ncbi:Glutathione peroxidase-like peroxiredoxin 2 [Beauveria bassiana]|nr:Glutathione peroxidase-like peroxiredoxin 2 [Beauveria bassiana]